MRLREEHNIELVMHKVDAHKYDETPIEEITDDWGGLLNKQADNLAKLGRRHGEVQLKQANNPITGVRGRFLSRELVWRSRVSTAKCTKRSTMVSSGT